MIFFCWTQIYFDWVKIYFDIIWFLIFTLFQDPYPNCPSDTRIVRVILKLCEWFQFSCVFCVFNYSRNCPIDKSNNPLEITRDKLVSCYVPQKFEDRYFLNSQWIDMASLEIIGEWKRPWLYKTKDILWAWQKIYSIKAKSHRIISKIRWIFLNSQVRKLCENRLD